MNPPNDSKADIIHYGAARVDKSLRNQNEEKGGSSSSSASSGLTLSTVGGELVNVTGQGSSGSSNQQVEIIGGNRNSNSSAANAPSDPRQAFDQVRAGITASIRQKLTVQVPTDPIAIRNKLREYGLPIKLFAERPENIRERLTMVMTNQGTEVDWGGKPNLLGADNNRNLSAAGGQSQSSSSYDSQGQQTQVFYHEGCQELGEIRFAIAEYSLDRSRRRIEGEKKIRNSFGSNGNLNGNHSVTNGTTLSNGHKNGPTSTNGTTQSTSQSQISDHDFCIAKENQNRSVLIKLQQTLSSEVAVVGSERPLTHCKFSDDGQMLCTTGLSGELKLWNMSQSEDNHNSNSNSTAFSANSRLIKTLKASSSDAICRGIGFAPKVNRNESQLIGAAMQDGAIYVWSVDTNGTNAIMNNSELSDDVVMSTSNQESQATASVIRKLIGHEQRVNRVCFHPMSKNLLLSTSHDQTWRLWDINRSGSGSDSAADILVQEGHSSHVYGLAIHPDGSLVCTTDLGGVARLWDLRTGRAVVPLTGHSDAITSCDFSTHGYTVATASNDHTVRIWDLRKKKCQTTIQAHNKSITDVCFDKASGNGTTTSSNSRFLLTSSFDKTLKLWSMDTYQCVKVCHGHAEKIMATAINPVLTADGKYQICSVSHDRTFKLWESGGGFK